VNPLRLRVSNYRCFDELTLELPTGCVAVLGENGAGKSSIVSAIDLAIFGPESRSLADYLADTATDGEDLLVELEFEHAGVTYRVRRTYSARGRGKTTLDFEEVRDTHDGLGRDTGEQWYPLTCESAKATQERIEQTIGLSRETFRASAFLAQGDGAAFTEAQPRDRKRILAEVLGLDRYDALLDRAKADGRRVAGELERLAGRTQAASELVQTKADVEREHGEAVSAEIDAADMVADREREHRDLAEQYQAAREIGAMRSAAQAELTTARAELDRLLAATATAECAEADAQVARDELATLATPERLEDAQRDQLEVQTLEEGWRARVAEIQAAQVAAEEAARNRADLLARATDEQRRSDDLLRQVEELEAAPHDAARCDRCQQVLAGDARAIALKSIGDEADKHSAEAGALRGRAAVIEIPAVPDTPAAPMVGGITLEEALVRARGAVEKFRIDQAQRARLEERLVQLRRDVDARPTPEALTAATELVHAKAGIVDSYAPVDLDAIAQHGLAAKRRLDDAKVAFDAARTQKARLEERLAQIRTAEEQLAEAAIETAGLHEQAELAAALERAFGPNGIPMLVVENAAIPYLETEATRILAELGTSFRVELRTQAQLKSAEGVRDSLDVIVLTEQGERPYETFSGGERTRLNLALRIALARLLAHRRGADSRLLCIDEPEFLDEAGTAALVDVLRGLQDDFYRVYLISHVPALRDSFDEVLTVVKDADGRSRVVEAGVLEAVEA
jgi:DNA repair protein SbcC/Rad50